MRSYTPFDVKYKRIILKLSGEAMAGGKGAGIDFVSIRKIAECIKKAVNLGVETGIVIGGGNFWRGRSRTEMDRVRADQIGMLSTVLNCLALQEALDSIHVDTRLLTAFSVAPIAESFTRDKAVRYLEEKKVVVFGGGLGLPFFSTDSAAALRAFETDADVILKATTVDGVYDKDPKKHADAKRYSTVTFSEVLKRNLQVMDSTAAALCKDNRMPIIVFDLSDADNILRAICGEDVGTIVKEDAV